MVIRHIPGLLRVRDRLTIDGLIARADILEAQARGLDYQTETPFDFLYVSFVYRALRDPKHLEIPRLIRRIKKTAPGYDPSLRFSSERPNLPEDCIHGFYELGAQEQLHHAVSTLLSRYPHLTFQEECITRNFPPSRDFSRATVGRWLDGTEPNRRRRYLFFLPSLIH